MNFLTEKKEKYTPFSLSTKIDHTLLKLDATAGDIEKLCQEALQYQFASVCVRPSFVSLAAKLLNGSTVKAITVVSFPHGANPTQQKIEEAQKAIHEGAQEIDMVISIEGLKNKNYSFVYEDISQVVKACGDIPVKVILETCLLNQEEKIIGCALSKAAQASFVKTSTGFSSGGATVEDIRLMRKIVGPEMGVKASGGVRSIQDAIDMVQAGATRLGTSSGVTIATQTTVSDTTAY